MAELEIKLVMSDEAKATFDAGIDRILDSVATMAAKGMVKGTARARWREAYAGYKKDKLFPFRYRINGEINSITAFVDSDLRAIINKDHERYCVFLLDGLMRNKSRYDRKLIRTAIESARRYRLEDALGMTRVEGA